MSKLACLCGWEDELQKLVYTSKPGDLSQTQLLGHAVDMADLDLHRVKLCTECIRENGFVQAHFDLAIMVACPIHKIRTVTHCASCKRKLSQYRPGLLLCKCWEVLSSDGMEQISEPEAQLLDIVRRKALSLPLPSNDEPRLLTELEDLSLQTLLDLIGAFGKHLRSKGGVVAKGDKGATLRIAAEALSDWPVGFYRLLDNLGGKFSELDPATLRSGPMASIYLALLRVGVSFALAGLSNYCNQNYGEGCRSRLAEAGLERGSPTYMSKNQAAEVYGIRLSVIDRTIEMGTVRTVAVTHGNKDFVLIDSRDLECNRTEAAESCKADQAAKIIGIPPRVLLWLRKSGFYQSSLDRVTVKKFYLPEVRRFALRFDNLRAHKTQGGDHVVRFDLLMKQRQVSVSVKANVIGAVLSAEHTIIASEDGTVGGILIPKDIIRNARAREQAVAMPSELKEDSHVEGNLPVTTHDAAKEAECSREAIHHLVRNGVLRGKKAMNTLWIDRASLTIFTTRYTSILSITRRIGTSTPALMSYCDQKKIYMLIVRDGIRHRRQGFVYREDVDRILEGATRVLGAHRHHGSSHA